jgi:hypothetical protein
MKTLLQTRIILAAVALFTIMPSFVSAASLSISPSTGVYTSGSTFTVRVLVNTQSKSVNAAEGVLKFNPQELQVVSATRAGSIFNLWVTEPTFSNSAGTVDFSGGLPSGYTGAQGNIMSVTFRALGSGPVKVNINGGSVLANDGMGTNILTAMSGGTYTIQAQATSPTPEVIEYVAPANTPAAPVIKSDTHSDPTLWYKSKTAKLNWTLPSGVTSVRTLLDKSPTSVPTRVYETPISSIELTDLEEGVSYFHLQFRNEEGWGRVSHYRLAVDTVAPESITISQAENNDFSSPIQTLNIDVKDATSPISKLRVKIDNQDFYEVDYNASGTITLPTLNPGYHVVLIEASDAAGNSVSGTYSFTIESFAKPYFVDFPSVVNDKVVPVLRGVTRPSSIVEIILTKIGAKSETYEVTADESGNFAFIPPGPLVVGVYDVTAVATDSYGAKSEMSDTFRLAVEQPGLVRLGSYLVSVLSVIVSLIGLSIMLVGLVWFMVFYFRRYRSKLRTESGEVMGSVNVQFEKITAALNESRLKLESAKRTKKLTETEARVFDEIGSKINEAKDKIIKEVKDVEELLKNK